MKFFYLNRNQKSACQLKNMITNLKSSSKCYLYLSVTVSTSNLTTVDNIVSRMKNLRCISGNTSCGRFPSESPIGWLMFIKPQNVISQNVICQPLYISIKNSCWSIENTWRWPLRLRRGFKIWYVRARIIYSLLL